MTCVQYLLLLRVLYCKPGENIEKLAKIDSQKSTGCPKIEAYISEQYLENEELLCSFSMALCAWFPANNCIFFLVSARVRVWVCVCGGGGHQQHSVGSLIYSVRFHDLLLHKSSG